MGQDAGIRTTSIWPARLTRYSPWAVGAAVFLLSAIAVASYCIGLRSPRPWRLTYLRTGPRPDGGYQLHATVPIG